MNKQEKRLTAIIMTLLFALLALGIAGSGDIEVEEDSARMYNEMVCKGYWPDYDNKNPVCKKGTE
jgi:hypothetical protein